jgi:hypothetical protein
MAELSDMNRWMSEDVAFTVLGLSRGAGQDLVAQGMLRPVRDGIVREPDIVEGVVAKRVRALRGHRAGEWANAWHALREEGVVDVIVERAASESARQRLEIVVDEMTFAVTAVVDDDQLSAAVRGTAAGRSLMVIDLTDELNTVLVAFRRRANRGAVPATRRGRPRKSAAVHDLPNVAGDA